MAQWVKVLATKPDALVFPWAYMVEGENLFLKGCPLAHSYTL